MKIIRHPKKKKLKGCVVALGTFDGVHLGHQKVLKTAVKLAKKKKVASLAITFDPHPQQVVAPRRGLRLLTTLSEREDLFCSLGIDGVVVVRFNKKMQNLSAEEFIERYLVKKLGVSQVVVGYDYAFGKKRAGSLAQLRKSANRFGFEVVVVPPVHRGALTIKSGLIRQLVSNGHFNDAVRLLGHSFQITGKVVKGKGVGKTLGFPTANLKTDKYKLIPAQGVYVGLIGKKRCAINIGARPTFGMNKTTVEVHIPGFHGNLRGKTLQVALLKRLRDEKQFADVEKLKKQIKQDIAKIRRCKLT